MPEMSFKVRWPDGNVSDCYSPSTIIASYLEAEQRLSVDAFMAKVRDALHEASERVRERYGYACSSAMDQLGRLEHTAQTLAPHLRGGEVTVLAVQLKTETSSNSAGKPDRGRKERSPKHYSVCVIGGGQAGLSMSYLLKQEGIEHIVLEKHDVAHSWNKERWDSFCLVTPNYQCRLPGYQYSGKEPDGFMVKDEIVGFLKSYAAFFQPPLVTSVGVERVAKMGQTYLITTNAGMISADQVVVATGGYHTPKVPPFATDLPKTIEQVHSRDYKNPEQLPEGEVLVVGSGQSGCQIVEDLMLAGRKVHLSVGDAPRCARRYRGRDVVEWLELMGHYDIPIEQMPDPAAALSKTNHYVTGRNGGHDIDLREFAQNGLRLYGTLRDYKDGHLCFAPNLRTCLDSADDTYRRINSNIDAYIEKENIEAPPPTVYSPAWQPQDERVGFDLLGSNIKSIVWSIGFAPNFSFIEPDVLDERGSPVHTRGVTQTPGLYFLGLPWQNTWGSGRFCGVAKDAEYLLKKIKARVVSGSDEESRLAASSVSATM